MTQQQVLPFPANDSADPIEAADEWLVYLYSGSASDDGKVAFRVWLADSPEHVQAYKNAEQLWRDMGLNALSLADFDECHIVQNTELEIEVPPQSKSTVAKRQGLAALAASVVLIASMAVWWFEQDTLQPAAHYVSHTAQILTISLEDNSSVVLSADSSLTVSYSKEGRNLNLLRGRAYFEVAPDPSRPFVVSAGNATATALGTAFDVNIDEGVTVSVTHGTVNVESYPNGQSEPYSHSRKINAGQWVRTDKLGAISSVLSFDMNEMLAWRSGRLVYQGEKLSVITAEINRYRTKKIRLLDKTLQDKRITLSVASDKTEQVIAAIQATEAVRIVHTPTEILISQVLPD